MPKNINLIELKELVATIQRPYQNISATIGLLSYSALNPTELMPEMCHLLTKIFQLSSCGFFWSDRLGNMQDAWCVSPDFLNFNVLMSCLEYQASGTRTWPPFQENVMMGAVAGYLLPFQNERFYASQHYHDTYYKTNGTRHVLDVVLHDGQRPFGAFLLMRNAQQGCFTPDERKLLERMIPILNRVFIGPRQMKTKYSEKEVTGFALINQDGKCISMSEEARRIVWTLSHVHPGSFADPNDPTLEQHLERLVSEQWSRIKSGEKFSIEIDNRWGSHRVSFEQEPRSKDTIVTLHRKIPFVSQLAFYLNQLDLPPVRQMVAWLLAQNLSRSQIASSLGVSVETVASHIKLIYKEMDTSSSHGLMIKLAA